MSDETKTGGTGLKSDDPLTEAERIAMGLAHMPAYGLGAASTLALVAIGKELRAIREHLTTGVTAVDPKWDTPEPGGEAC